jgi:hypothetical protein
MKQRVHGSPRVFNSSFFCSAASMQQVDSQMLWTTNLAREIEKRLPRIFVRLPRAFGNPPHASFSPGPPLPIPILDASGARSRAKPDRRSSGGAPTPPYSAVGGAGHDGWRGCGARQGATAWFCRGGMGANLLHRWHGVGLTIGVLVV